MLKTYQGHPGLPIFLQSNTSRISSGITPDPVLIYQILSTSNINPLVSWPEGEPPHSTLTRNQRCLWAANSIIHLIWYLITVHSDDIPASSLPFHFHTLAECLTFFVSECTLGLCFSQTCREHFPTDRWDGFKAKQTLEGNTTVSVRLTTLNTAQSATPTWAR